VWTGWRPLLPGLMFPAHAIAGRLRLPDERKGARPGAQIALTSSRDRPQPERTRAHLFSGLAVLISPYRDVARVEKGSCVHAQALPSAVKEQPRRSSAILAGPLRRAVQTAAAIAAACGFRAEVNDKIRDRDGPPNGHLVEEVNATWGSVGNAPGVESRESVLARARSALTEATTGARHGSVVLVSHDAINSALLAFLDPDRWPEPTAVPQTDRMSEHPSVSRRYMGRRQRRPETR
jgi:hypothetical protein